MPIPAPATVAALWFFFYNLNGSYYDGPHKKVADSPKVVGVNGYIKKELHSSRNYIRASTHTRKKNDKTRYCSCYITHSASSA